jgi:hypothetical protein
VTFSPPALAVAAAGDLDGIVVQGGKIRAELTASPT